MCHRSGADTKAEDFEGRTSAHLAAARGELGVLAVLLQVSLSTSLCAVRPSDEI